jgi:hypothetical protein
MMVGRPAKMSKNLFVHVEKRVVSANSLAFRQQWYDGAGICMEDSTLLALYACTLNVVSMLMSRENDQIERWDITFVVHSMISSNPTRWTIIEIATELVHLDCSPSNARKPI